MSPQHQHHVRPPLPQTNSTRTPVITANLPISQTSSSSSGFGNHTNPSDVTTGCSSAEQSTAPPADCPVNNNSSSNCWERGKEPVPQTSTSSFTNCTPQQDSFLQPGCPRSQSVGANQFHQQGLSRPKQQTTKSQLMSGRTSFNAQGELEQSPLFSTGQQRAGDSVITSRILKPYPRSPTTYCPVSTSRQKSPSAVNSTPLPSKLTSFPGLGHQQDFATTQVYTKPQICPPAPTAAPQSIEEALDKLDAELKGHMQAVERGKRDREDQETNERTRKEDRHKTEWEIMQNWDFEKPTKEQKKTEEIRNRESDRQEAVRKKKDWERQERDTKERQDKERRRKEMDRLEEERKKREQKGLEEERTRSNWEREQEQKKREWEEQEEKKKTDAKRQEHERKMRDLERQEEENKKQQEMERKGEEIKRMQCKRESALSSTKGKEQTAIENLERLLSGSTSSAPPPPRLSVSAPPSGSSLANSQASTPYPWLSRGGVLRCPSGQALATTTPVERLRPPPLTPQTEYAREKQRQREMWSNGTNLSPSSTHNTSGMNLSPHPSKPPAMKAAPNQSKEISREKDNCQQALSNLALREPPKLYQAFPREKLVQPHLSSTSSSTRNILNNQDEGCGNDGSFGTDSDSAQFEEEAPELSTMLPDGLANIMAMLDESIKKEEEMFQSQKTGSTSLLDKFSSSTSPIKSYLCAPDLIPATKHQPNHEDFGSTPHASPPVLSRQGSLASPCSRTSSLNEEDEDYLKPSPGVPTPKQPMEMEMRVGNTSYRHSDLAKLYGLPEQTKSEADEEEEEEDSEIPSCSPPSQRPHLHQTGVNSMFKSLATVLESQKYAYRGGPFGRPPPSALVGVKYSSSLSLGPDICCQQQGSSPTSESFRPPFSSSVPPLKSSPRAELYDKKLKLEDADVWRDDEETTKKRINSTEERSGGTTLPLNEVKEEQLFTTISESSLAELGKSCEVIPSRESPTKKNFNKSDGQSKADDSNTSVKVKEHREKYRNRDRKREKERKRKHGYGHSSSRKHEERKERKKHREKIHERAFSSSLSSTSSALSHSSHKRHKDGKTHKEKKDRRILGDLNLQSKEDQEKNWSNHYADKKRKEVSGSSSAPEGEQEEWMSRSAVERSLEHKKVPESAPALGTTDFLKLKALSDGPPKELKIRLIKVESGDRETFIASEVEERRIPLEEISIKNSAIEIIRSCK